MKKIAILSLLAGVSLYLTSCMAGLATREVPGFLYAETTVGHTASGAVGSKEGKACAESILGLIATGDASIKAAAKQGGVSNVTGVSRYVKNYLGAYAQVCTIVTGN